jgi:hypothetical protein
MTRDVAIIGAGPQGLGVAAHLTEAGVDTVVFGRRFEFWREHMPRGMFLRSSLRASSIADPTHRLSLERYSGERAVPLAAPLPLQDYLEYGEWFNSRTGTELDSRLVRIVEAVPGGFRLTIEDGDEVEARRVVVAAGIAPFARRPPPFSTLPQDVASHSFDHTDFTKFAGRSVLVVGAGQSALESAALLAEAEAEVELLVRAEAVRWLEPLPEVNGHISEVLQRLLYPPTDVGPRGLSWIVAAPDAVRRLPVAFRRHADRLCVAPAGSDWLAPRLADVRVTTGRRAVATRAVDGRVLVETDEGGRRMADHVLLATGYDVDVSRYRFLDKELLRGLRLVDGYPVLSSGLESSVPGLHFVGAAAAFTFGPVMRFVCGGWYAARAVRNHVLNQRPRWHGFSW